MKRSRLEPPAKWTEPVVRQLHDAPARARVSTYEYAPGEEIAGTSRACTLYIVDGHLRFMSGAMSESLLAGEVFEFAGGDYRLEIDRQAMAVAIWAWPLSLEA